MSDVRYFIKYNDTVDVQHILNIYDDNYVGEAEQVDGQVFLTYSETENNLEAIRGQGLRVDLEANQNLTFENLWSENEKTYRVEYKRDDVILFNGWLNPEGFFENYVDTDWIVSFDCVDGLGYLENLSFVDENGFVITGRKSYIELLSIALFRTGLTMEINTSVDIRYEGLSDNLDVMANLYANTERYVKDDGETIMSCEEVVRDILEPFGAVLTSYNNEWYIYKPNQLFNNTEAEFYNYYYNGLPSFIGTKTLDFSFELGSQWNGYYPHHCNGNQTIKNTPSITAYRVNYKYGLAQSLLDNYLMCSLNGFTLPDWVIKSNNQMTLPSAGECGVTFQATQTSVLNLQTEPINMIAGLNLQLIFKTTSITNPSIYHTYRYQVVVSDIGIDEVGAVNYYLSNNGEWGEDEVFVSGVASNGEGTFELMTSNTPITGFIYILIHTPYVSAGSVQFILNEARISVTEGSSSNAIKGEFHSVQRLTKPSSKIDEVKEVATGDNIADIYEGTLYKADGITPTEFWSRKGYEIVDVEKPILQVMGEETLRMSQLPSKVFSGDVFGYFKYLSVVTINGFNGLFMPIKYSYDTKQNIIQAELKQIYGGELVDIAYKKTYDYGNTVKPTII